MCALSGNFDPVWLSRCSEHSEVMRGREKHLENWGEHVNEAHSLLQQQT